MKFKILTLITPVFLLLVVTQSHAADRTVCASGCQYTTIQSAVNASADGDNIRVGPGTYAGATINKRVSLISEDFNQMDPRQNTAKITGSITIQGSWPWNSGVVIRGFHFNTTDSIIGFGPMTVEYNYVTGGSDGISFEKGGGGIARGNYIENTGDDCFDVDNQTQNIIIEKNTMLNCGQDGIEIRQQNDTISSRTKLTFEGNYVDGSGEDGLQIMDYNNFSNRSYFVNRNLFMRSGKAGIGLMAGDVTNQNYSAPAMPEPLYATNNTFVDNDAGISGGANLIAINNIFTGQKTFDLKNVNGASKIKNSLFSAPPKLQGTNNLETSTTKTGNPLLDSSFKPQAGSPAIDAGITSYSHTYIFSSQSITDTVVNITPDLYTGAAPDVGWLEAAGGTNPTATTTPPTSTPTTPAGACPKKNSGDADCKADTSGKSITIIDFEIWRKEYLAGCSSTNLTAAKCQLDDDTNGSLMDANFDSDNTVTIADFQIWRQGYFNSI